MRISTFARLVRRAVIISFAAAAACGPDARTGDGSATGTLRVEPDHAVLTITDGAVTPQGYKAIVRQADGTDLDVTSEVAFTIEASSIGTFSGPVLVPSGPAGRFTVTGTYGDETAAVDGTIKVVQHTVQPPAPTNSPELFDAATDDPLYAPSIAYPSPDTVFPPNLGDFDVHWTADAAHTLFEVTLEGPYASIKVYVTSLQAFVFTPAQWAVIADSTRGRDLTIRVRALDPNHPTSAGKREIGAILADADVIGGVYYWSLSSTAVGVFRHDFADASVPPEAYYTTALSPHNWCVACHALSADGTRIGVSSSETGAGGIVQLGFTLNASTRTPLSPTDESVVWDFATFNPDASLMATVMSGQLTLRAADTGAVLQQVSTAPSPFVTHPDWSPIGDKLAYTALDHTFGNDLGVGPNCRISIRSFDAATRVFGTPSDLVPPNAGCAYYPNFSPDGAWLLYDQSQHGTYSDDTAMVSVVPVDGSMPGAVLATPNVANTRNSWPRWTPFQQTLNYTDANGTAHAEPILWFTFSTTRPFGTRSPGGTPQIWMAPFFPARKHAGLDPSAPAFRLPFQDLASNNHAAQWTHQVVVIQ
jgi:Tol biopolymer transport system component